MLPTLPRGSRCCASAALLLSLAGPVLGAQQQPDGGQPQGIPGQAPAANTPGRDLRLPTLEDLVGPDAIDPDGLSSTWMPPQGFQGFPVFPSQLQGYGIYPPPPGFAQPPGITDEQPPTLPASAPDWPTWIKQKRLADLPYDPANAVLVRQSDRVWLRVPGDDAFVPLYHYDTTRPLTVGCDVRVVHTGDFLLHFFGGARMASTGPTELHVEALDEQGVRLAVPVLTRLELVVYERRVTLVLPDGSELIVDPPVTEAPTAAAPLPTDPTADPKDLADTPAGLLAGTRRQGAALLLIERAIEPGRFSGRARIFNSGSRPVRWHTPFGDRQLDPGHRVALFLSPPAVPLSADLVEDGVQVQADGPRRAWSATHSGGVTWSGAHFTLAPGQTLSIDPMLGDPFAAKAAPDEPATKQQ